MVTLVTTDDCDNDNQKGNLYTTDSPYRSEAKLKYVSKKINIVPHMGHYVLYTFFNTETCKKEKKRV